MESICKGYLNYRTNYYESFSEFVYINNNMCNNYLKIICCNIRSANEHLDELLLFLENDAKYRDIDIIVLMETWHNAQSCNYVLDGYSLYFYSINRNQNYGVMVFAKHYLSVEFF
jgi:exonuclease III